MVQISSYIDTVLASFLAVGAVSTLLYATTLYVLPVSLFGMSVAAAELPELARQRQGEAEALRVRTSAALRRIAFYIVPSFVAFVLLGDVAVAALYQTGEFGRAETLVVHATLIGFSVGLLATTSSRLFSSTFFALRDTVTPARYATVRVVMSALLGVTLMLQFESVSFDVGRWSLSIPAGVFGGVRIGGQPLGAAGLALGGGIAAWAEWILLKRALRRRIGTVGAGSGPLLRMFGAAFAGAAAAWGVRLVIPELHPVLYAVLVLGTYGVMYFALTAMLGVAEARATFGRIGRLFSRFR